MLIVPDPARANEGRRPLIYYSIMPEFAFSYYVDVYFQLCPARNYFPATGSTVVWAICLAID